MTPLRASLISLVAALATTATVAATVGPEERPPAPRLGCAGWTAYLNGAEVVVDPEGSVGEIARCWPANTPPEGWPPGAQPPPEHHFEIQIIR